MTAPAGLTLDEAHLRRLAEEALVEDRAFEDVTTAALVPPDQQGRGVIVAKGQGIIAGLPMAQAVFLAADSSLSFQPLVDDGSRIVPGQQVAVVEGVLGSILRAERVALNFLQRLSGVATHTARFVAALSGTSCRLRDTRKTTPGLRVLEKYAVRLGGGTSHRPHLAAAVLIKDNHLAALRARDLGVADAVRLARQANPTLTIEVEVTSVDEARQALAAGADELLLDNMSLQAMWEVVALAKSLSAERRSKAVLEASGGVSLDNVRQVAETGVDYVSVGAITHSAPALDMSLEVEAH